MINLCVIYRLVRVSC